MSIAEELSNEQDKNKELLANLGTYETELQSLRYLEKIGMMCSMT